MKANNGARHELVEGFRLGHSVFATVDGQPSANASLDPGDDGVILGTFTAAYGANIAVVAHGITPTQPGFLDAWIDFNADGDWNDAGEQILDSEPLVEGTNSFPAYVSRIVDGEEIISFGPVVIPADAVAGTTFARFRYSSTGGLSPTGTAASGEVEDYQITINANPWQNSANRRDVNGDNYVTPIDALLIINLLNFNPDVSVSPLPVPPTPDFAPPPYYDVNGDGYVSPIDALAVINYLNGLSGSGGEGESEEGLSASLGLAMAGDQSQLVDSGLDSGLSSTSLWVMPDVSTDARVAATPVRQLGALQDSADAAAVHRVAGFR